MTNADRVLDALGDPTRRGLFTALAAGPSSVSALAKGVAVSRPAVSQHLKVLKEAELVVDRAEGTRRIYAIRPEGLTALRGWLDQFWDEALDAFARAAEQEARARREAAPRKERGTDEHHD